MHHLMPMLCYRSRSGERLAQWSAADALVLKWLSLQVDGKLLVHERCEHRKHAGGVRASVKRLHQAIQEEQYRFVYRTDIRGYYRHIRKTQAYSQFCRYVRDPVLQDLFRQYLYYSVENGGEIHTPENGIARGCSLSPLVGASLLYHCDCDFNHTEGIYYARYMDDFMVLTRTRWHLRRCVRRLNEYFDIGGFSIHPDKTYTGRIQHGFDWPGVSFDATGATGLSDRAIRHHRERCLRLYEQTCRRKLDETAIRERVQAYRKRWRTWGHGLLNAVAVPDKSIQIRATFWRQGGNRNHKPGGPMGKPTHTRTAAQLITATIALFAATASAQPNYTITSGCLFDNRFNTGVYYAWAPIVARVIAGTMTFQLGKASDSTQQSAGKKYQDLANSARYWDVGDRVTVVLPAGKTMADIAPIFISRWSCDNEPTEVLRQLTLRPTSPAPVTPGEHKVLLLATYQNDVVVDVYKGSQPTEINYTSGG